MKLGKYKGIQGKKPNLSVADSEIDNVLRNKQHENAVVTTIDDRCAQNGDQAVIDYSTECEGQSMPNGSRKNYPLTLGSHTFVPGFEESIIGHEIHDSFDVTITFPSDYRMPSMANKPVTFHITLKQLRLPEYQTIDDDFAKDFSEFDTLDEWKAQIAEDLRSRREASSYEKLARELLSTIIADSEIPIDRGLLKEVAMELYEDFLYELEDNGMTFEMYCKRSGLTKKQIRASKEEEALRSIQEQSVLHAIANLENLEVSEEELAMELCEMAEEEGEDVDVFVEMLGEEEIESIVDQLQMNKAISFVLEHAVLV